MQSSCLLSPASARPAVNPWTVGKRCTCHSELRPAVGYRTSRQDVPDCLPAPRQRGPGPPWASSNDHASTPAPGSADNGFVPQHERPRSADATDLQAEMQTLKRHLKDQAERLERMHREMAGLKGAQSITTQQRHKQHSSGPPLPTPALRPLDAQLSIANRRALGMYDARFHSTQLGATPNDFRVLPAKIILVRHAESEGNINNLAYTFTPDPQVPLTERGIGQATKAGQRIREVLEADGAPYRLFFYTSPYKRSHQTYEAVASCFQARQVAGQQEEVQLREQDFGNFQDMEGKQREKAERLRFGRFFYRFPNGESGADVYDRMTIFEDHLVRDINAGRYSQRTSLVLVTHGLALRVFLMRWFHWSVDQFMQVFNPPNAEPLVLERIPSAETGRAGGPAAWQHTKALYRLSSESRLLLQGCTDEMCRTQSVPPGDMSNGSHS